MIMVSRKIQHKIALEIQIHKEYRLFNDTSSANFNLLTFKVYLLNSLLKFKKLSANV